MEGPNGPNLYQQIISSSQNTPSSINIHTNSSAILPIVEPPQILSKVYTNGDASVTSEKIYDEIDELKFEIKTRAATAVSAANIKAVKSKRSSFISKILNFHRNPPHSLSIQNHCQTFRMSPSALQERGATEGEHRPAVVCPQRHTRLQAIPYKWPHDGTLKRSTTALVIIDMQKDFASAEGYLAKQNIDNKPILDIVPNIRKLLDTCRAKGYPIYHTREGHRPDLSTLSERERYRSKNNSSGLGIGDRGPLGRLLIRGEKGHEIIDELAPRSNEPIIDKPGRSAFQHTEFRLMLNIKGIKNLIICGVTTDVCVTSTMRDANDNNFDCVLVKDACAAGVLENHKSAVASITEEGGIFGAVTTVRDVLNGLGAGSVLKKHKDGFQASKPEPKLAQHFKAASKDFISDNPSSDLGREDSEMSDSESIMEHGNAVSGEAHVQNERNKYSRRSTRTRNKSKKRKTILLDYGDNSSEESDEMPNYLSGKQVT
ncbi:putative isochorismatase family protein [Botrytis fragariae]|uniref:Putative isochorismatase family protein n=1 Tax=Botrytis fragariae TaxID=1964551 RepID=A0A8H6EJ23_9HELO|nr:putative isochorismatase family protein [Botrytis fragariae]KAF5874052.1 putative isochorismatase family protein [Botrytis fragariae]